MNQLEALLAQCTVKLILPGLRWGTGFFVASEWILTCAHVVQSANGEPVEVRWQNQENWTQAVVQQALPQYDLALLRAKLPKGDSPPCVYLDAEIQSRDPLYLFGYSYPDFPNGCPAIFRYEGFTGDEPPLIKFQEGQVQSGMSGSPLLNQRTGKVCGIVKFTRAQSMDLGGGAVPTSVILAGFPQLQEQQLDFHKRDLRWVQRMGDLSESLPVELPENDEPEILSSVSNEMEVEVDVDAQHKYNGELVFMELKLYNELEIVEENKFGIRLSITFGNFSERVSNNSRVPFINAGDIYIRFGIKHGKLRLNLTNGSIPLEQRQLIEELNNQWLINITGFDKCPVWEFESRGEPPFLQGMCVNKRIGVLELLGTLLILEATFEVSPSRNDIKIIDFDYLGNSDIQAKRKETMIIFFLKNVIKPKLEDYLSRVVLTYGSAPIS